MSSVTQRQRYTIGMWPLSYPGETYVGNADRTNNSLTISVQHRVEIDPLFGIVRTCVCFCFSVIYQIYYCGGVHFGEGGRLH